ncbi:hypothetical protein SASPL_123008 [Salvia splendens]|uniref:Arp2/3 complex 34 kDa subunit n=1 Tax=Salvia splendens TaxID=180675 RepID=A0A8X8XP20_SALSN|nr:hypothetical protein SASPL_123008 [Salvia splendens]
MLISLCAMEDWDYLLQIDDPVAVALQISPASLVYSGSEILIYFFAPVILFSSLDKGVELDCQWVEFDDVRYHIQATVKNPNLLLLSLSLPAPPPETVFFGGLPQGAIEAIKAAYGVVLQVLDPPRDGYNLTVKLNLSKLPPDEDHKQAFLVKIASADKVTVIFPMRFKDSIDTVLATSFLQEFVEARRTAGLNNAPPCLWSSSPPKELEGCPDEALSANAGFVSFVIFPRHVENRKLDRTVWSLSTFHAYVSYHVKCSEGFMHTRMRRRVETLIELLAAKLNSKQALDRAKPDSEKAKNTEQARSFKRMSIKDSRSNSNANYDHEVLKPKVSTCLSSRAPKGYFSLVAFKL